MPVGPQIQQLTVAPSFAAGGGSVAPAIQATRSRRAPAPPFSHSRVPAAPILPGPVHRRVIFHGLRAGDFCSPMGGMARRSRAFPQAHQTGGGRKLISNRSGRSKSGAYGRDTRTSIRAVLASERAVKKKKKKKKKSKLVGNIVGRMIGGAAGSAGILDWGISAQNRRKKSSSAESSKEELSEVDGESGSLPRTLQRSRLSTRGPTPQPR